MEMNINITETKNESLAYRLIRRKAKKHVRTLYGSGTWTVCSRNS